MTSFMKTEMKSGIATYLSIFKKEEAVIVELRPAYRTHSGGRCQFVFATNRDRLYAHMN